VRYRTIVADPPWRYDNGTVPQGGVEHQYRTMTPDEIIALPVAALAADNAHLYLWVTNLHLHEGRPFDILDAFGVRGRAPLADKSARNHFAATKGHHSRKPDRFYEIVERVSPGPYLELFARRRRYGWDVWGNEAPTEAASQAEMGLPDPAGDWPSRHGPSTRP